MQVAIIVGHTLAKPGAKSPAFGHEYGYNRIFADKIYWELRNRKIPSVIFYKDGLEQSAVARQVNEYARGYTVAVELHFNAFNGEASGTETLYDADPPEGKILAAIVQRKMCEALGRTGEADRGARLIGKGDRGHYNLASLSVPACLVEPFFGDNPEECALAFDRTDALVRAICDGIQFFESDAKAKIKAIRARERARLRGPRRRRRKPK